MIAIICADNRNGTFFNGRRQSRDRLLCAHVLERAAGRRLWMNACSARQFPPEAAARFTVDEDPLSRAGPGELCFVEGAPLLPWLDRLEGVVVYRWNRDYPADRFLDLALDAPPWRLLETEDFPGSSHKFITKEVYIP